MGSISVATECVEFAKRLGSTGAQQQTLKLLTDDYDRLRRYLRGRVRTAENAEDVLHDFCLKVVTHSGGIQRSEAVGSWMTQILRRTLIDHYRRSAADHRCADVLARNASSFATEKHETQEPICPYLQTALPAIKQEYVDLIRRIDFLGERRCDVAENLAISVNALTVRLLRARRALRKKLLRFCETDCDRYGTTCNWSGPNQQLSLRGQGEGGGGHADVRKREEPRL